MNRRMFIMLSVLCLLLTGIAIYAFAVMSASRTAALAAQKDLVECRSMAGEIRQLRTNPVRVTERERLASEMSGMIETAAGAARIAPESIARITPEPPRRVGETVYKEKPTQVVLRGVTLRQLVTFAHGLVGSDNGLNIKAIRLIAPREKDANETWTAELTLTYLIYEPRSK